MSEPPIVVEINDGVADVVLNRPEKRNALTPEMIVRLADAWDRISADPTIRVVILSGAGDKAFCAGADLARLTPLFMRARSAEDEWDEKLVAEPKLLNKALLRGIDFEIPVIGALRGTIVAGGMELALACDLRVVADDSRLGLAEVRRALIPAGGGIARVSRQIPTALAAEVLLVGETLSAQRAYEIGLVNAIVASEDVMATARELAGKMAQNGPLAMRMVKRVMLRSSGESLIRAFDTEDECIKPVLRSNDAKEGSRAFVEKRPAVYSGI